MKLPPASQLLRAIEFFKSLPNFPQRKVLLRALLRPVRAYDLTYDILERYADLRRAMRKPYGQGLIGDADTPITATAIEHGQTVVRGQLKHPAKWRRANRQQSVS